MIEKGASIAKKQQDELVNSLVENTQSRKNGSTK